MGRLSSWVLAVLVVFVAVVYVGICGLAVMVWADVEPPMPGFLATGTVTMTRHWPPLPVESPYPTSTRTRVPTSTPLFPDYFFPTRERVWRVTVTPTFVWPTVAAGSVATEVVVEPAEVPVAATVVVVPTVTPVPSPTVKPPPFAKCTCVADTLNCGDFEGDEAQQCYDYCWDLTKRDVHGLDGNDQDHLACEP